MTETSQPTTPTFPSEARRKGSSIGIEDFNGDSRRPDTNRTTVSLRPDTVRFGLSVYL